MPINRPLREGRCPLNAPAVAITFLFNKGWWMPVRDARDAIGTGVGGGGRPLDLCVEQSVHGVAPGMPLGAGGTHMSKSKRKAEPKKDVVVFAFRLPAADRDAIHKAAGPGRATRYVHAAALASARGDTESLEARV